MQLSTCIRIFEVQERLLWHCRPSATDRRFFLVCLRYRVTVCTLLHPQYEHPRLRSAEPSKKQLEKGGRLEVGNASSRTTRYWGIKLSKICLNYIVGCYYGGEGPISVSSRKEIGPKKKGSLELPPVESVRIAVPPGARYRSCAHSTPFNTLQLNPKISSKNILNRSKLKLFLLYLQTSISSFCSSCQLFYLEKELYTLFWIIINQIITH